MSRLMREDQTKAYRAVIVRMVPGGRNITYWYGPYAKPGQARAVISRHKRYGYSYPVSGHVEETTLTWQPFSNEPAPGKLHTDSTGTRYVNIGDGSTQPWIRIGRTDGAYQWFSWEAIETR